MSTVIVHFTVNEQQFEARSRLSLAAGHTDVKGKRPIQGAVKRFGHALVHLWLLKDIVAARIGYRGGKDGCHVRSRFPEEDELECRPAVTVAVVQISQMETDLPVVAVDIAPALDAAHVVVDVGPRDLELQLGAHDLPDSSQGGLHGGGGVWDWELVHGVVESGTGSPFVVMII
jgi:hypothetical protein